MSVQMSVHISVHKNGGVSVCLEEQTFTDIHERPDSRAVTEPLAEAVEVLFQEFAQLRGVQV
jgi:hypothetical protein